ncbi:hypothetical protein AX15_007479 [Amanita polypyramis BW_CC]|nr:hypothetical protein AX15_007479 [Amanita polypyramis BW_CC]
MSRTAFHPTPHSIPPKNAVLRFRDVPDTPVNFMPLNPTRFLLQAAEIYPDKIALTHPDVEYPTFYTFSVWAQRVQNLTYALIKFGIKPGDRVAVIAPNCPMIADAHYGVLAARAVLCSVNTRIKRHDVDYILEHSGSKIILVDHEYTHLVEGTKIPYIVCKDTGREGDPYEAFLNEGRIFSQEKGWQGLDVEADENAPCTLIYTSGTTGRPKGVVGTLRASFLTAVAAVNEYQLNGSSVYLWTLPMFHASGWVFPWANVYAFASQITVRTVNHTQIWNHLLNSGVTHYAAAPTVQIGLVNHPLAKKTPQAVTALVGGAAPTPHLIGEMEKKGIYPIHVYGLTETYGPTVRNHSQPFWSQLSLEERSKYMARQGYPFKTGLDARVVYNKEELGDKLVDVPRDGKTLGEIVLRGNLLMKEYFNDPAATKKTFKGGAFRTGDLAVWHPDGSIAIADRSKDIIISGGENASSIAIEQELVTHPHVLEAAVVPRQHAKWGERPMAFVTLRPEHAHLWKGRHHEFELDLKKHAKTRLPGFACPEWVVIVPELPKTSTGKIVKTELRKSVAKL